MEHLQVGRFLQTLQPSVFCYIKELWRKGYCKVFLKLYFSRERFCWGLCSSSVPPHLTAIQTNTWELLRATAAFHCLLVQRELKCIAQGHLNGSYLREGGSVITSLSLEQIFAAGLISLLPLSIFIQALVFSVVSKQGPIRCFRSAAAPSALLQALESFHSSMPECNPLKTATKVYGNEKTKRDKEGVKWMKPFPRTIFEVLNMRSKGNGF